MAKPCDFYHPSVDYDTSEGPDATHVQITTYEEGTSREFTERINSCEGHVLLFGFLADEIKSL